MLLLVLVAIVVGIAITLAIVYFRSNQQETEINEVINELNHIAVTAQGWYRKPAQMGGGGNSSFVGFTLRTISQPDSTDLAKYEVTSATNSEMSLLATGYINFTVSVSVYPDSIGSFNVVK